MRHLILASALLLPLMGGCGATPAGVAREQTNDGANVVAKAEPSSTIPPSQNTPTPTASPTPVTTQDQPTLAIDGEGLRWFLPPNGSARPLPFGTSQSRILDSLERVRGKAAQGTNADCGAGPVQYASWADGLSLVFQKGRFVGWGLDGRATGAISTADGVGPGTTRSELDDAFGSRVQVRRTSLGTEFTAGAFHGVLDANAANARITDMWAGVSCVAR